MAVPGKRCTSGESAAPGRVAPAGRLWSYAGSVRHEAIRQGDDMTGELDARAAGARRLKDKVCVVTGAGQGIGRATARRLGQEGGRIVVADRIDESATKAVTELHDRGVEAVKALVDLTSFAGAQELMRVARATYDRID